jgi:hypothetical protein
MIIIVAMPLLSTSTPKHASMSFVSERWTIPRAMQY